MTPNNQTINKFVKNEDKTEEILSGLKKLMLEDSKCISYSYVSLRFGVHVKEAILILDKFVAEERNNGNTLSVNYVLSGNNDSKDDDNETKMERFMIINESELESATDWFKNGFNKHIYSVGFGEDNDKIDLNFEEYDYEVKDKNQLNDLQKYIKNPNIEFRNINRRVGIKTIVTKSEEKTEKPNINSKDNKEIETKSKTKTNTKAKNSKKKISNMFSKNKKEVKLENESKEIEDPFESGSEEDTKPKVESNQTSDVDNVSEEEVIEMKTEPNVKNKNKRHSKNDSNTSDDEEIVSTKRRNKKYKRVRLISESDSDDNKEEPVLHKFVSNKNNKNSKPIKKLEEVKETHVDEDGYVVTKTVKREVTKEDIKEEESKESDISDKNEDKEEITEKTKPKAKKTEKKTDKPEKKPQKPSKDTKGKGQSSITSFFKPKQILT